MLDLNPIKYLEDHVSSAMALIMLENVLTDLILDITTPRAMASVKARVTTWLSMRITPTSSPPRAKAKERRARMPIGWTLSFGPRENQRQEQVFFGSTTTLCQCLHVHWWHGDVRFQGAELGFFCFQDER